MVLLKTDKNNIKKFLEKDDVYSCQAKERVQDDINHFKEGFYEKKSSITHVSICYGGRNARRMRFRQWQQQGGSSTETGSAAEASSSGETADDADDKSPITFEYFNADGKNGNWDNPVAKAITEATGVTLDVSYPVASQGDAKKMLR